MSTPQDAVVAGTPITTLSAMERGENRTKTAQEVKAALTSKGNPLDSADSELLDLLHQWDTNGDGQFSVEEVLLIARHFRKEQRHVNSLKRTLCFGAIFTIVLLVGILFVTMKANDMTKDMRPDKQGILTDRDGKVTGVAAVLQRGELEQIPTMKDEELAELQFVSFDLKSERYMLKVAGAVKRQEEVQGESGPQRVVDLFFVNGPFTKMNLARNISVFNPDGNSEVVDTAGKKRRLGGYGPWSHIGSAGTVGISGVSGDARVAPWSHIGR